MKVKYLEKFVFIQILIIFVANTNSFNLNKNSLQNKSGEASFLQTTFYGKIKFTYTNQKLSCYSASGLSSRYFVCYVDKQATKNTCYCSERVGQDKLAKMNYLRSQRFGGKMSMKVEDRQDSEGLPLDREFCNSLIMVLGNYVR